MINLFDDIDLETNIVNEAYEEILDLLDELFIKDADIFDDMRNEIAREMANNNPFDAQYPTRKTIKNLFEATARIIKKVYPNAVVTYKEYPHNYFEGVNLVKRFSITVDDDTYRLVVKRMAEEYDIDEDEYLRKHYGIDPKNVE